MIMARYHYNTGLLTVHEIVYFAEEVTETSSLMIVTTKITYLTCMHLSFYKRHWTLGWNKHLYVTGLPKRNILE